jgi:hypothetical protein
MLRKHIAGAAIAIVALAAGVATAALAKSPWPDGSKVYIISPKDGETITGPVTVLFGLKGMGVAPAGVEKEKTGHHHILINAPIPADLSAPLPADDNHRHFGGGQTQATLELKPGKYTLQLLMGDHNHIPHNPPLASEVITITVK